MTVRAARDLREHIRRSLWRGGRDSTAPRATKLMARWMTESLHKGSRAWRHYVVSDRGVLCDLLLFARITRPASVAETPTSALQRSRSKNIQNLLFPSSTSQAASDILRSRLGRSSLVRMPSLALRGWARSSYAGCSRLLFLRAMWEKLKSGPGERQRRMGESRRSCRGLCE